MFHNQRKRLLRKERWSADELAQELWAMFGPEVPLEHRGPVTLYSDGEHPAITYRNFDEGDSVFAFDDGDTVTNVNVENNTFVTNVTTGSSSSSNTFPGEVQSHVSGNNYLVEIYPSGLSGATSTVTVRQLSIADGEEIESGTWAQVSQSADGTYFMQVPVWG
jgi:hypothetical protein